MLHDQDRQLRCRRAVAGGWNSHLGRAAGYGFEETTDGILEQSGYA
jgi:hypothetical protein